MKATLTTYDIADRLLNDEFGGWSRAGALALAEFLEQMEEDTGEEMDLDVVAIRCDFSEHSSLQDWAADYGGIEYLGLDEEAMAEDLDGAIRDYIQDNGWLIEFDGGVIVSSF